MLQCGDLTPYAEIPVAGGLTGTFANTQASDDQYEKLTEAFTHAIGENKWLFNVTGGGAKTFYVEAYQSGSDNESFVFSYSPTDALYTDMVTITKGADDNTSQSFVLPPELNGTIYIRVQDSDRSNGDFTKSSLFVDLLLIHSDADCIVPTSTPSPSATPSETPTPSPTDSPTPSPTPFNDAMLSSASIVSPIATNHDGCGVQITLKNTGNTAWTQADLFALAVVEDPCNLVSPILLELEPDATIQPGEEYTFTASTHAPASAGTCSVSFQMEQEGILFGEIFGTTVEVVDALNDATAASHTIPSRLAPGQSVLAGATFTNKSNVAWCGGSSVSLKVLNDSCSMVGATEIAIEPGQSIAPNAQYQFVFPITAPLSSGHCTLQFRMSDQGIEFGGTLSAELDIVPAVNAIRNWTDYE